MYFFFLVFLNSKQCGCAKVNYEFLNKYFKNTVCIHVHFKIKTSFIFSLIVIYSGGAGIAESVRNGQPMDLNSIPGRNKKSF
jgi:hypothetical protein